MKTKKILFIVFIWLGFSCICFSQNVTVTKVGQLGGDDYRGVVVRGNYAYCAADQNGFIIVDISIPSAPLERGRLSTAGRARAVSLSGNVAYVVCKSGGGSSLSVKLDVIDISSPASPSRLGSVTYPSGWGEDIALYGQYACVAADFGGLQLYDLSDPANPAWVSTFVTKDDTEGVTVSGNYAYVPVGHDGLQIVNISNPFAPALAAQCHTGDDAEDAVVSGKYLYLADGYAGLRVMDISNPRSPTLAGTCDTPVDALGVAVSGDYAYIADGGGGLQVIDISNPTAPVAVGSYDDEQIYVKEIAVSGGYIYLTDGAYNRLYVFSISAPSQSPFGCFETPGSGAQVSGSIAVTGWALDDVKVENVKIYREQQGGPLAYIGDAVFVDGARPDIETSYPGYPLCSRAGWGYMMLTNFLPDGGNGTYVLHAVAADAGGNTTSLGTTTIHCDNANAVKPFGAIDTPAQGGEASGSAFTNAGWVLTPPPNSIPIDGSTIDVYVDGKNLGHPAYNLYRSDIAGFFPGYANADGAMGVFEIDTTAYKNGVYIIYWTAVDSAGNGEGIGSRYFTISNASQPAMSAGSRVLGKSALLAAPKNYLSPVGIKKGFNRDGGMLPHPTGIGLREVYPGGDGCIQTQVKELERIEIWLDGAGVPGSAAWSGCQVVGDGLRPLPVGSTLDAGRGIFYWTPGPGFLGRYRLILFQEGTGGEWGRTDINIDIHPAN